DPPPPNEGGGVLRPLGQLGHEAAAIHVRRICPKNLLGREESLLIPAVLEKQPCLNGKSLLFITSVPAGAVPKAKCADHYDCSDGKPLCFYTHDKILPGAGFRIIAH